VAWNVLRGSAKGREPFRAGDRHQQRAEATMLARILVIVTLVLASVVSHARDNGQYAQVSSEIKRWVEGLTDEKGRGCCATADGVKPEEVEWDMTQNAYRVMIGGHWFNVPDGAVIKESNKIGYALVWYYTDSGNIFIRCFLPGSGA
jgi:hypothetical protein